MHGIVDASPAWVSQRLDVLAQQLLLPAPARDSFLFDASPEFYAACTESIITLQRAAKRIVLHLGLRCDTVICAFKKLPNPGNIQRVGNDWFMEISSEFKNDGYALGAILAHEVCHILVEERRVPHFENAVDEVHVDLACMLSGLGALTLNGIKSTSERRGDMIYHQHRSFGYMKAPLMYHAYAHVCAALGIGVRRATAPLRDNKTTIAIEILLCLRRAELAYKPLAPHVIVPCASVACAKRLRMPTGKLGTARCPECKTSRDFDGRVCRTRALDTPVTMREAPVPPPPNVLARLAMIPAGAKIMVAIWTAIFVALWFAARVIQS